MKVIGYIHNGFEEKFGIPRQSGLADTEAFITLVPPYNVPEAVRGLEGFSHIWILWDFSMAHDTKEEERWSPTVRPPRLGGNKRIGVFATRSPFRPNNIGLSCVKLDEIIFDERGPVLKVRGADLLNKTPIYDIKPYVPYSDSVPDARSGFAAEKPLTLDVCFECELPESLTIETKGDIEKILAQDPRPAYHKDSEKIYGMKYNGFEIKFKSDGRKITVCDISF